VLALVGLLAWRRLTRKAPREPGRWKLPEPLTPFTGIALLERIHREDLQALVESWVRRAR
jgi:hypothetical protein